jgi:hypothetical protein
MITRREFLALSTFAVAAPAWAKGTPTDRLGGPVFSEASQGAYTQGLLSRKHLEALVGSLFMVFLDDDAVAYMRLKKVGEFQATVPAPRANLTARPVGSPTAPPAISLESFYAQFDTGGIAIKQDSYLLDHGTLGRFTVFLVPSPDSAAERTCTATFTSFAS